MENDNSKDHNSGSSQTLNGLPLWPWTSQLPKLLEISHRGFCYRIGVLLQLSVWIFRRVPFQNGGQTILFSHFYITIGPRPWSQDVCGGLKTAGSYITASFRSENQTTYLLFLPSSDFPLYCKPVLLSCCGLESPTSPSSPPLSSHWMWGAFFYPVAPTQAHSFLRSLTLHPWCRSHCRVDHTYHAHAPFLFVCLLTLLTTHKSNTAAP